MNENLQSRLINYKFDGAKQYLAGEPEEIAELVDSLAAIFGDSGYFGGHVGTVVSAALKSIGVEEE